VDLTARHPTTSPPAPAIFALDPTTGRGSPGDENVARLKSGIKPTGKIAEPLETSRPKRSVKHR
jgi:hypothetical protein